MKILIDRNDNELYLFVEEFKKGKLMWRIDTVCDVDEVSRFFGRIYNILVDKEENKNGN